MKKLFIFFIAIFIANFAIAQNYNMGPGNSTITTCSGNFYDSGGPNGNYSNNQNNYVRTFCSGSTMSIRFTFISFVTEAPYDSLQIFDGPDITNPHLMTVSGSNPSILLSSPVTSSGPCLTFRWKSGTQTVMAGWNATISCVFPCQGFLLHFDNTTIEPFIAPDTIHICQNTPLSLSVTGEYPGSTPTSNYQQADNTTFFTWNFGDGTPALSGGGMVSATHTWPEGAYWVTVKGKDVNNCYNSNLARIMVIVSLTPTFAGTNASPDTICPGNTVTLDGNHVQGHAWALALDTVQAGTTFIPDGAGGTYSTSITNTLFATGQTLPSSSDISVCINMEHSYFGDLTVTIECPNGTITSLFSGYSDTGSTASGSYLGIPLGGVDHDLYDNTPLNDPSVNLPGTGYDYCFGTSAGAANPIASVGTPGSSSIPAGTYYPTGAFTNLVGCPLNGNWTIHVLDDLGYDNGYIFSWELHINPTLIPPQFEYENIHDTTEFYWTGPNILQQQSGQGTAAPTAPGNQDYVLHVLDDFGCAYDTTVTMFVRSIDAPICCAPPLAVAGNDTALCSLIYTLDAQMGAGNVGTWSVVEAVPVTIASPNSQNSLVTVTQYGVYHFVWTESPAAQLLCIDRDTVVVTFYETPTSDFITTQVMCFGDSTVLTYTGTGVASATYDWVLNGGISIPAISGQGPYAVKWPIAGLYDATLQVVQNGCASTVTTIPVFTPILLQYTDTFNNNKCFGDAIGDITINPTGGILPYIFSWALGLNVLSNLSAGTYDVTVTDANACNFSVSYTLVDPPQLLIPSVSAKDINCFAGNDGFVSVAVQGGTGTVHYDWTPVLSNSPLQVSLTANTYSVTVTDENACTDTKTVILSQPAQLNVVGSPDVELCFGDSTILQANAVGGVPPYVYSWNGVDSTADFKIFPTITSVYLIKVKDDHDCISNVDTIHVLVSPKMTATLSIQNVKCFDFCDGMAQYVVTGGISPFTYSWSSSPSNVLNNLCLGPYTVTVTDQIGCKIDTSFTITQPTLFTATVSPVPVSCHGYTDGSASVSAQGGVQPYNFLWSNGSNQFLTNFLTSGNYSCTIKDFNGCVINKQFTIAEPSKVIVSTSDDATICIGGSTNISAQVYGGTFPYSYKWVADSLVYTTADVLVSPVITTNYHLTVTDAHICTGNSRAVKVNVFSPLSMSVSTLDDTVCPGDAARIRVDIFGGNNGPYMLYLNNGTIVAPPFNVFPVESQMYYLTAYDRCETPAIRDSVHIEVLPAPQINPHVNKYSGCPPLNLNFIESSQSNDQIYLWHFGEGLNAEGSTGKNPAHTFLYPGTYWVQLTVRTKNGCERTDTMGTPIEVFPLPEARFYLTPEVVPFIDPRSTPVEFTNISLGEDSVLWFFGDGDSSSINNPSHSYRNIGIYKVELIACTKHNCNDTVFQNVSVKEEFTVFTPTAFSPNNDNHNDFFSVSGKGILIDNFSLYIYNRWGETVFTTKEKSAQWDGKVDGKVVENGVYTWVLYYKDTNGTNFQKSGHVTVLR